MNAIFLICTFLVFLILPIILIVGLIKPTWIIPIKINIKNRRMLIFFGTLFLFILFAIIGGNNSPDLDVKENEKGPAVSQDTISIPIDSAILIAYKTQFDSLYVQLMRLDSIDDMRNSRSKLHGQIQNLLFNEWWGAIEQFDSLSRNVEISKAVYYQCARKYDKEYARFMVYGDEDEEMIRFWAESESKRILKKLVRDPKSLKVENVKVNGKTKKGWNCTVVYRATNGFGGYVREYKNLTMAYDIDNTLYKCISMQ
ncbi:MAG: hypothetical protein PWQ17_2623 [Anaerophaga sp.]|jgi:hypothetical protein|nr:hypothetical protein [Anaerophaga sp.]